MAETTHSEKINAESKFAISIVGSHLGDKEKSIYENLDIFINNLLKFVRLSNTDYIITDAKKMSGKISLAKIIEKKVQENPFYSNNYDKKIELIGVTSLDSLICHEETNVGYTIILIFPFSFLIIFLID